MREYHPPLTSGRVCNHPGGLPGEYEDFGFDGQELRVSMFIISEYAVCVLAVWIGMTLLFMASVMFLALGEGCIIVARKLQELTSGTIPLIGRQTAVESQEP